MVDIRAFRPGGGLVRQAGVGAGVVVSADGLVVTSYHVLTLAGEEVARDIRVILSSGKEKRAILVGTKPEADLAVLSIEERELAPAGFVEELSALEAGQLVVAIGSSALEEEVTSGRLTRVLRNVRSPGLPALDTLLQVEVPLQQGNSGGPLVDAEGRVIGIVIAASPGAEQEPGAGFAIPAPTVLETVREIVAQTQ